MKTTTLNKTLVSLNIVLLMSIAALAHPMAKHTGDLPKTSGEKTVAAAISFVSAIAPNLAVEKHLSYLRFDVNDYIAENEPVVIKHTSLDYLRFDVDNYASADETSITEMPESNSLGYLRFDADNFIETEGTGITGMPEADGLSYLRFDANNFVEKGANNLIDLPTNEYDSLRFDVKSFSGINADENGGLPECE